MSFHTQLERSKICRPSRLAAQLSTQARALYAACTVYVRFEHTQSSLHMTANVHFIVYAALASRSLLHEVDLLLNSPIEDTTRNCRRYLQLFMGATIRFLAIFGGTFSQPWGP